MGVLVVVPAAICIARAIKGALPPGKFAAALLAGYEAMTRFGAAIDGPHVVYRGGTPAMTRV